MEKLLENDEFIHYIVCEYSTTNDMTYQEKIQTVFSSMEEFTKAMNFFQLSKQHKIKAGYKYIKSVKKAADRLKLPFKS